MFLLVKQSDQILAHLHSVMHGGRMQCHPQLDMHRCKLTSVLPFQCAYYVVPLVVKWHIGEQQRQRRNKQTAVHVL